MLDVTQLCRNWDFFWSESLYKHFIISYFVVHIVVRCRGNVNKYRVRHWKKHEKWGLFLLQDFKLFRIIWSGQPRPVRGSYITCKLDNVLSFWNSFHSHSSTDYSYPCSQGNPPTCKSGLTVTISMYNINNTFRDMHCMAPNLCPAFKKLYGGVKHWVPVRQIQTHFESMSCITREQFIVVQHHKFVLIGRPKYLKECKNVEDASIVRQKLRKVVYLLLSSSVQQWKTNQTANSLFLKCSDLYPTRLQSFTRLRSFITIPVQYIHVIYNTSRTNCLEIRW